MNVSDVIRGVVVSEASSLALEKFGTYTLKVADQATKSDIKLALKTYFDLDAVDVNVSNYVGRTYKKMLSKKGPSISVVKGKYKKAFVKLKSGQSLPTVISNG
jgi:large subunit ribosomal protein L23